MCGYSSLKNTNTGELEDRLVRLIIPTDIFHFPNYSVVITSILFFFHLRLDSFVLAETFKYFYLLFADKSDVGVDMEQYVFTTEAHLIPIHIQRFSNDKVIVTLMFVTHTVGTWRETGDAGLWDGLVGARRAF